MILSIYKYGNIKWYVDEEFAVHKDMSIHTGGLTNTGMGGAYVKSNKQKLNSKRSTEAELVGVDDVLTQLIWTRYFLKEQGYEIYDNVIYQDNQIFIKLDKSCRQPSRKRTRNINIIYYFITERITNHEASMEVFYTLDMIRDYFTKALQGYQFKCFHHIILGIHEVDITSYNAPGRARIK